MASLITEEKVTPTTRVLLKGLNGDVAIPPIACGTWSWGDKQWDYSAEKDLPGIKEVTKILVDKDIAFLDTAEVYGTGESERIIGGLLKDMTEEQRARVVLATKWLPIPIFINRWLPRGILSALQGSLDRLGVPSVDLYQCHAAWTLAYSIPSVAKNLAACVHAGLAKTVGVSNYSKDQMIEMYECLKKEGVPLASNQIEFNLLRTLPETSGIIQACHERGIVPLAYSPLAMGRLTGKYSVENPPPENRRFSRMPMSEVEPLLAVMREIAEAKSVPVSAVALNWVICKGAVPLGGARNGKQAQQNAECLGWKLTDDEMKRLAQHAKEGKLSSWQKG
ncbi:hypothetical protein HKX48_008608 [Thoreauomyces humboldtii]|nr:hypothetical protein HKX48_008608 [Thoreauomyces humboldtii]